MGKRSASQPRGSDTSRSSFTPPKGRPTRRRDGTSGQRSMTTLQWFLVVLALVVAVVVVALLVGPGADDNPVPTGSADVVTVRDDRAVSAAGGRSNRAGADGPV